MLTKEQQLKFNKTSKDLTEKEKTKYFTWIKQNKTCLVCGAFPEIHHLTNKSIKGARRLHSRVVPLCFNHHSAQSPVLSIHGNTNMFYDEVISLDKLLKISEDIYKEYLNEKK